jgi:DNA-binding beta-propeller fold protein YncE
MKIQSLLLASLLAPLAAAAQAPTAPPSASAQSQIDQRAEALSQAQIEGSHDITALSALAQIYATKQDFQRMSWTLKRLTELLPNSGDLKLQLAMTYCKLNEKSKAYDTLLHMQVLGFGYDIAKDPRFDAIHGTRVWDYLVGNLQVNSKPFGEGKAAFELAQGDHVYDALAWDPKRKQLLLGSRRDGSVQLLDESGKLTPWITADAANGPWSADAIGVDAQRGKLYIASSASPLFKGFDANNAGHAGVFEFDLASGKLEKKYILPLSDGAHILSRIAVAKDGNVYVADGARRTVYKLEGGALKEILSNPRLTGISGLTVSDDGKKLYLSDYAMGIFGVDLSNSQPFELKFDPASLVLGGIDSLAWYQGHLVVAESGMTPKRVMRLKLSDDGHAIETAMPLDVAQPAFGAFGQLALAGDKVYVIANREDDLYDGNGVLTESGSLEPTAVWRSDAHFAWGQKGVSAGGNMMTVGAGTPLGPVNPKPGVQAAPAKGQAKAKDGKQ